MASKHTPGTWKAEQARGNNRFAYKLYKMVGVLPGVMATIEFSDCDRAEANAQLIAAAPQLLKACKRALEDKMANLSFGCTDALKAAISAAEKQ